MDPSFTNRPLGTSGTTLWHLCWQVSAGRDLLVDSTLKEKIRRRLLDAHSKGGRVLVDLLVLRTEMHVVSRLQAEDTPGRVAHAVGNIVARWARDVQPLRIPVFSGRVGVRRIPSEEELRQLVRMLAWRPVFQGASRVPSQHALGGLRPALGLRSADGFDVRPLLSIFGRNVAESRRALAAWIRPRPPDVEVRLWEFDCGLEMTAGLDPSATQRPLGARSHVAAMFLAVSGAAGLDGAIGLLEVWVARQLRLANESDACTAADRLSARARALVACLATQWNFCTAAWMARRYRRAKSTLSEQMAARRGSPADRLLLATPAKQILREALVLQQQRQRLTAKPST